MREIVVILLLLPIIAVSGNLDKIRRALEKAEFEKVEGLIAKSKAKEPLNPGVDYYSSLLFTTIEYPNFSLDSGRIYINLAIEKFNEIDEELKEDLAEDEVTIEKITTQKEMIRDQLFRNLSESLSLERITSYREKYPESPYDSLLTFKTDSIVYGRVAQVDTQEAYERFISEYHTPYFKEKALIRLDELRFEALKSSTNVEDYYQFLKDYPSTAFTVPVEAYILKRSTADQQVSSYVEFMDFASTTSLKKKAGDVIYYLDPKNEALISHPTADSLRSINSLKDVELIPALEEGKFGFYSREGKQLIPHLFESLNEDFKCQLTTDEWLYVTDSTNRIIAKNGKSILTNIQEYTDLGDGIAKVKIKDRWYLYHKSGFQILPYPIEDAAVLNSLWIKVKRNDRWGLFSFVGYEVAPYKYEAIETLGPFWVFAKNRSLAVYNKEKIREDLDQKGLELEFRFHDVELIDDNKLIGFRENRECMLDSALKFLIPWGIYQINPDESGWYLKSSEGYRLYDQVSKDISNEVHPYLETNAGWLALKTKEDWLLLPKIEAVQPSKGYDSLKLISDKAVYTERMNKRCLIFSNGDSLVLSGNEKVMTFNDQSDYLLIESRREKKVIDISGDEIVKGDFREVTFFNDSLIKAKVGEKFGLIRVSGGYLIKPEFQAIDEQDGLTLCLRNGKIGCYDLVNETWIHTKYEARIERLGVNYLVKEEGMFGVLDAKNEYVIPAAYEEIKFWNDTAYLVREDGEWLFINSSEEQIGESFEYLAQLVGNEDQSIWEYVKYGKYGLLSTKNGFLIEPEFSEIQNIGSEQDPLFFADQNLKTAGFHVVSYVDASGNLIMSKAYKNEEFDRILCED